MLKYESCWLKFKCEKHVPFHSTFNILGVRILQQNMSASPRGFTSMFVCSSAVHHKNLI